MKRCAMCGLERPRTEFGVRRRSKDGLQPLCRDCNKARSKAYYARNRAAHRQTIRENTARYQAFARGRLVEYLVAHPCVDCGEIDLRLLEFDHRPGSGKSHEVGYLMRGGASWSRVSEELAKCDVRCVSCHRLVTYARAGENWRTSAHSVLEAKIDATAVNLQGGGFATIVSTEQAITAIGRTHPAS